MDKHLGRINMTGNIDSRIGKVHKFVVHAEHTESRKGHDYDMPVDMHSKHKPKSVTHHEFTIRKVSPAKAKALKERTK